MKNIEDKFSLNRMERVKKISFELEMFSTQNNLLTPTFKLKRNFAKKRFASVID